MNLTYFMQQNIQPTEKNNKLKYLLIAVILVLLATNGILVYFYINNTNEIVDKKKQLKFTTEQLIQAKTKIDSMSIQIELRIKQLSELSEKYKNQESAKNDSLTVEIKELKLALAQMKKMKSHFKEDAGKAWRVYNDNKGKIDGYGELLVARDKEIADLKKITQHLYNENTKLKHEKVRVEDVVDSMQFIEEDLKKQVKIASALEAENITVSIINKKKKEKDKQPFNGDKIALLKIDFTLAINKVALVEMKTIYLKIMDPKGKLVLDPTNGKNTFSPDGKVFTSSQGVMYTRDNQLVTFKFSKGGNYSSGIYKFELYCEEVTIGTGTFEVK